MIGETGWNRARAFATVAAAFILVRTAGAQVDAGAEAGRDPLADLPTFGESFVKMILWLGVLVALLLVAATVLPRWMRRRPPAGSAPGQIEVLASISLEPRRRLYLVRAAGRRVLIGSSESGLCRLAGDDASEPALGHADAPHAPARTPASPAAPADSFDAAPPPR